MVKIVAIIPTEQKPAPYAKPVQPHVHNAAAVVKPLIWFLDVVIIVPAPMKPIPDTTPAPILDVSALWNNIKFTSIPTQAPKDTKM